MAADRDVIRFGPFEVDAGGGALTKGGRRLRLQDQPLQVLLALLERPGRLVTRDELHARLWPNGTFVDFEDGLNTAVRRLRSALGDSASRPRYVETHPRRGYRFIGRVDPASAAIAPLRSVAVLPLDGLSGQSDDELFADAMTDELITSLAKHSWLKVISRGSTTGFKRSTRPIPEIGRALGVDAVIEGTVIRLGDRVRVTAQLIEAAVDRHLWADSYERDLSDVLALQRDLAQAIACEIDAALSARHRAQRRTPSRVHPDAYLAYIVGRSLWDQRNEAALLRGIEAFARAVQLDPNYAAAWAGIADCYTALGYGSYLAPRIAFEHAGAAARKALELDPALAESEAALGYVALYHDWSFDEADRRFRRALTIDRGSVTAHQWYSVYLTAMGRFDAARQEIRHAREIDPLSAAVATDAGFIEYYAGQYDEAIAALRSTISVAPRFPLAHLWLGRVYQAQARFADAAREFEATLDVLADWPVALAALGHALGESGDTTAARRLLARMHEVSRGRYVTEYGVALVHASLGDRDSAFDWLDRAVAARAHWLVWLKLDPRWNNLRDDPRFRALLERLGFST